MSQEHQELRRGEEKKKTGKIKIMIRIIKKKKSVPVRAFKINRKTKPAALQFIKPSVHDFSLFLLQGSQQIGKTGS